MTKMFSQRCLKRVKSTKVINLADDRHVNPNAVEGITTPDMGWSNYINSVEEGNYEACESLRKKKGLPVDIDLFDLEFSEQPCYKDCQFIQ